MKREHVEIADKYLAGTITLEEFITYTEALDIPECLNLRFYVMMRRLDAGKGNAVL